MFFQFHNVSIYATLTFSLKKAFRNRSVIVDVVKVLVDVLNTVTVPNLNRDNTLGMGTEILQL